MTVGKIYAGMLILENYRLAKQPQGREQSVSYLWFSHLRVACLRVHYSALYSALLTVSLLVQSSKVSNERDFFVKV